MSSGLSSRRRACPLLFTMRAVIILNGTSSDFWRSQIKKGDLVICADGGANGAREKGISCDVVIGDMDSIDEIPEDSIIDKDENRTDVEKATSYALDRGANSLLFLGAVGDRLDHTLANILILDKIPEDIDAMVLDDVNELFLLKRSGEIEVQKGQTVSLIPLSTVKDLTLEGFRYPLEGHTAKIGSGRTMSNVAEEEKVSISFSSGSLLVVKIRKISSQG